MARPSPPRNSSSISRTFMLSFHFNVCYEETPGNGEEDAMEEEEEEKNSDSEEEQDTEESYLKMPERKLKDPAPV